MIAQNGFWVKGGKAIEVGFNGHIGFVIEHPEQFGLTKQEVAKAFKKYGEKLNQEGSAREELIKKAYDNGWVRIRQYNRPHEYWTVQFDKWSRATERNVRNFVEDAILSKKIMSKDEELVLMGFRDDFYKAYTFQKGGAIEFLKECKKADKLRESKKLIQAKRAE